MGFRNLVASWGEEGAMCLDNFAECCEPDFVLQPDVPVGTV
jgi:hypothetical protein